MSTGRWRGRAEWVTLVAVIFTAGYVAQIRVADAARAEDVAQAETVVTVVTTDDSDTKSDKVENRAEVKVEAIAVVEGNDKDGPVQIQVRMVGPDGKDIDVDKQPSVKVLKKIFKIREGDGDEEEQEVELRRAFEPPGHFLGIQGSGVDPILAKHLKLEKGQGILLELVVDDSPAEKAGLKQHDILLTANGKELSGLENLVEMIREGKGEEISLDLIRAGKKMAVTVKPAKRPKQLGATFGGTFPQLAPKNKFHSIDPKNMKDLQIWVEKMSGQGSAEGMGGTLTLGDSMPHGPHALRLRTLSPGVIVGGGSFDVSNMPGNLSVSIIRKNDEPAKIRIKQGDKTWEFGADDEEMVEELPDNIRKFIEPMLGNVGVFTANIEAGLPGMPLPPGMPPHVKLDGRLSALDVELAEPFDAMMERMEEMELRLKELSDEIRRMHGDEEDES